MLKLRYSIARVSGVGLSVAVGATRSFTDTPVSLSRNQVSARHIRVIDKICLHVIDIEA